MLVYGIAAGGSAGSSPIRLALAGAAIAAALTALINGLTLTFPSALDQYRFWSVGSIAGQPHRHGLAGAAVHRRRRGDHVRDRPAP